MYDFKPGQRWICDADLQLGLGTIQSVEHRIVTIAFNASGEIRSYAKASSPLTRVIFKVGDIVNGQNGITIKVTQVNVWNGLVTYVGLSELGEQAELGEEQLAHHLLLNRPIERLFIGQFDQDKWFRIRYQTMQIRSQLAIRPLYGLTGVRVSLIPHQLYIAHEVARRYAPRVLLADEVGLGKTIEAGLILHQQLLMERARRVLIIVPEALIHQWLVEMLRRFNLHFSIFDEERCLSLEENNQQENPFHSEQLVLCSLNFLHRSPKHFQHALKGEWDFLVVDEAHHLHWSEQSVSTEYAMIEQLAACTRGVLLLTATPEQLGKSGHFARLRLLDPDRFCNLASFMAEEQLYKPIANTVEVLLENRELNDEVMQTMVSVIDSEHSRALLAQVDERNSDPERAQRARKMLADLLLDRYGTGRVLFRNTRATIKGFPERKLNGVSLVLPLQYDENLKFFETAKLSKAQLLLCPELLYQVRAEPEDPHWTEIDPRIPWLHTTLKQLKPQKVLVIAAAAQTVHDIAQALRILIGRHIPVFHEGMSLVERDRAAAHFADSDTGSQILICSEIGSEGRNFQFSHHLVLFDLPLKPDLLEQRIGRLDRIGQADNIHIHVPYLEDSALMVMFHWYHQGLNAFERTCPAGQAVFSQVETDLVVALHQRSITSSLILTTQSIHRTLDDMLNRGRNRLLEYNSFRPVIGNELCQLAHMQDDEVTLPDYMEAVFDCCGVHLEEHRAGSYLIEPGEHMTLPFPGLLDEGTVITYSRNIALVNEDIQFLTWEHPMVIHAMDRILDNESGNAVVVTLRHENVQAGTLLLESLFVLEAGDHVLWQDNLYLPSKIIRILMDEHGNDQYPELDHESINCCLTSIVDEIAKQVIQLKGDVIRNLASLCEQQANMQKPQIVIWIQERITRMLVPEIDRLKALQKINPNVRDEEIQFLQQQLEKLIKASATIQLRLDAIRVIVAT